METEPCRGYYVAQIEELYHLDAMEVSPDTEQKQQASKMKYRYAFTPNGVDLPSFPYNAWIQLSM